MQQKRRIAAYQKPAWVSNGSDCSHPSLSSRPTTARACRRSCGSMRKTVRSCSNDWFDNSAEYERQSRTLARTKFNENLLTSHHTSVALRATAYVSPSPSLSKKSARHVCSCSLRSRKVDRQSNSQKLSSITLFFDDLMQIITLHAAEIANKLRHASRTDRDEKKTRRIAFRQAHQRTFIAE